MCIYIYIHGTPLSINWWMSIHNREASKNGRSLGGIIYNTYIYIYPISPNISSIIVVTTTIPESPTSRQQLPILDQSRACFSDCTPAGSYICFRIFAVFPFSPFSSFSRFWPFSRFGGFRAFAWPAPASPRAETHVSYAQHPGPSSNGLHRNRDDHPSSNGVRPSSDGLQVDIDGLHPSSNGLHRNRDGLQVDSDGLHPSSNGLHRNRDGLHPSSNGLRPSSDDLQVDSDGLRPSSNGLHCNKRWPPP